MRHCGCGGARSERIHLNEEPVVSEFCEKATSRLERGENPFIAIADIQSNLGVANPKGKRSGVSRGWLGGLTASQLREQLGITVSTPAFSLCKPHQC
jgi:hypothetical protein